MSTREAVLAYIKGKQVVIPDLHSIFHDWPSPAVNPHYQKLTPISNERLKSIFSDKRKLRALLASDFPFFAATWWPLASLDRLSILLYFIIWLFNWDDEIDEPSGVYADDAAGAQVYRARTFAFVRECLGLEDEGPEQVFSLEENRIIASFRDVGEALGRGYTVGQRRRFMDELVRFVEFTKCEQEFRVRREIPTVQEYWSFRMGTSAVSLVVAVQEYAMDIRINEGVMRDDERMRVISDETNVNIVIINDLLSLKKEIAQSRIDSLIPISIAHGLNPQAAINSSIAALQSSKARFDAAARSLRASAEREPRKYANVLEWVDGCRSLCVGNLVWSLETGRYGVKEWGIKGEDGFKVVL